MLRDRSVNCDLRLVATDGDFNAAYTRPTKHKHSQEVIKNNLQHKLHFAKFVFYEAKAKYKISTNNTNSRYRLYLCQVQCLLDRIMKK